MTAQGERVAGKEDSAMSQCEFDAAVESAKRFILNRCDGPVTRFVAISRATRLIRDGNYPIVGVDCPVTNALHEILYPDVTDDDYPIVPSSGS
jgi:hypothetical protein